MAKMFSLTKILRQDSKGAEELIDKGKVFNATPDFAKQMDAIKAARPATAEEIEAAKEAEALADGSAFVAPTTSDIAARASMPASGADGDPQSAPKGK